MNQYFILILIFISIIPAAFADLKDDRDSLLEAGERLIQEKNYKLAITAFDMILEFDQNDTKALFQKSQVLLIQNKTDEAMLNVNKVLEIDPNHIDALTYKADGLVRQNNTADAKPFYEKILNIDTQNVAALGFMGDEHLRLGNTEKALSYYAKVLSSQPYKKDPFGIQYFDKVLEKKPNDVNALNAKGTSMVKLGRSEGGFTIIYKDNLDDAISYFDRVLAIEPNNVDSLLNKGKALFQLEKPVEGMEYVDRAMAIDPDNVDALTFKGDELLRTNQTAQGTKLIDTALALDPKNINALFLKGRILILQKNYNDAYYYFDEVLDSNHNHIIAAENIKLIADILGYEKLDGFLDVKIHNSQGLLAGHLRVNNLKLLNHTSADNLVDKWPVTQIITRNGQEYEVLQYHITKKVYMPKYNGGAVHFGIKYEHYDKVWDILANYWMYRVQKGDTVDFVYTAFRPVV